MKARYCRRQVQAARLTVLTSGVFLLVLWIGYVKFPGVFRQADVDLVSDQPPMVQRIITNISDVKSESSKLITNTSDSGSSKSTFHSGDVVNTSKETVTDRRFVERITITPGTTTPASIKSGSKSSTDNAKTETKIMSSEELHGKGQVKIDSEYNDNIDTPEDPMPESPTNKASQRTQTDRPTIDNTDVIDMTEKGSNMSVEDAENNSRSDRRTTVNNVNRTSELNSTTASFFRENVSNGSATTKASVDNGKYSPKLNFTSSNILQHNDSAESGLGNKETVHNRNGIESDDESKNYEATNDTNGRTANVTTGIPVSEEGLRNNTIIANRNTNQRLLYVDMNLYIDERPTEHTILLWNTTEWQHKANAEVDMGECLYTNCRLTTNKRVIGNSSAVIVHIGNRISNTTDAISKHSDRNPNQVWVFQNLDPAENVEIPEHFDNVFNWTWTYRPLSDIFQPYGALLHRETPVQKPYANIYRSKKKIAAVFISDKCHIPNWIQSMIQKSMVFIQVDIHTPCDQPLAQDYATVIKEYMFHLGFESNMCEDFISEQFFSYFNQDVVTVVLGWGRYEHLPSGCFINRWDFESTEDLARRLGEIGSSEELYTAYLKNKALYTVQSKVFMYRNALCSICYRLNNVDKYEKKVYTLAGLQASIGRCANISEEKYSP